MFVWVFFFFQAEDGIRDIGVTGVQTCALPISAQGKPRAAWPPLLTAYAGALEVVEARHGFWPRERMDPLKRGLPLLDSATAREPGNSEIRYLRLTSCYYLPFFLGRKGSVKEDFEA